MDINDLKRPASIGPRSDVPSETPAESKRESSFADATAKIRASAPEPSLSVVTQFKQEALEDPNKLEVMVRACASELVDGGQHSAGPLSSADKQALTDFLSADPLFRRQIETYLRKVLT
jgi:hypothetical protein